jgi:hypothetical protein
MDETGFVPAAVLDGRAGRESLSEACRWSGANRAGRAVSHPIGAAGKWVAPWKMTHSLF